MEGKQSAYGGSQLPHRPSSDEIVIDPHRSIGSSWRDVWRYRDLFAILVWRDIAVRYKQTVIGIGWALIRPFLMMVVFTLVFSSVAKLPSHEGVPYPLLVFAAMLPWQFVSTAISEAGMSVVGQSNLVSKVFFPRLILPAGAVCTSLIDFLVTLGMMALMMTWYGYLPDWRIAALPLLMGLVFCVALGAGLWLAALNVEYRDFRYVIPFVVQFGLYVSPVGFSSDLVPVKWQWLYDLNPMVAVIEGFRWSLLGGHAVLRPWSIVSCVGLTGILGISGLRYFRRVENLLADII